MPDGHDVLPDESRAHASGLDALGDRLGTAFDAVGATADGVRDTAVDYDTIEQANTRPFAWGSR